MHHRSYPLSDQRISPDGLVHRKMEDIVYIKVHQDQDLFKVCIVVDFCNHILQRNISKFSLV